jgi:hypothetical protein
MRRAGLDTLETGMMIDVVAGSGNKGESVIAVKN